MKINPDRHIFIENVGQWGREGLAVKLSGVASTWYWLANSGVDDDPGLSDCRWIHRAYERSVCVWKESYSPEFPWILYKNCTQTFHGAAHEHLGTILFPELNWTSCKIWDAISWILPYWFYEVSYSACKQFRFICYYLLLRIPLHRTLANACHQYSEDLLSRVQISSRARFSFSPGNIYWPGCFTVTQL